MEIDILFGKMYDPKVRSRLEQLSSSHEGDLFSSLPLARMFDGELESRLRYLINQGEDISSIIRNFEVLVDRCLDLEEEDEYEDADEVCVGPGPSGNRKMRKNTYKKSPNRKIREKKPVTTTISRVIGIPDVATTRLQYNDVITLTGTTAQYTFRANSLFDPDFTGTGHQPTYFDQYIASYERYRVLGCSISISVINRSFTDPAMLAVFPVTEVPTITSISQAAEISRKKLSGILPSYQSIPIRRSIKMSTAEQIGLFSPSTVYTDDYAALFNANPVVLWYYGLYGWSPTTGGLDLIVDVQLNYDCQFFDRAPSTLSLEQQLARQAKLCSDLQIAWKTRCLTKKS